jgi:hypothetical protein
MEFLAILIIKPIVLTRPTTALVLYRLPSVFGHDAARIYKAFGLKRSLDVEVDSS